MSEATNPVDDHPNSTIDPIVLREAWRQAHFAAQAAAELGKSWAIEAEDDSHTGFVWRTTETWRGLIGEAADHALGLRAHLAVDRLELSLAADSGEPVASLALAGQTVKDAQNWIRAQGELRLGAPRQEARSAPDLPHHPLAQGAILQATEALPQLAEIYSATAQLLRSLNNGRVAFGEARCWPHHFDLASLAVLATDDDGAMTRTVGAGLTPPDSVEDTGYWYVSPWSRDADEGARALFEVELPAGRWSNRAGSAPMAVLPIGDATQAEGRDDKVETFFRAAIDACIDLAT